MWLWTTIRVGRSCSALNDVQRPGHRVEVVGVGHGRDVPAVGDEPGRHVLGEGDVGMPFDRHPVGVVDPAQVGQPLVAASDAASEEIPSIMQPSPASA